MTRFQITPLLGLLSAALLASCDRADTQSAEAGSDRDPPAPVSAPAAPSPDVLAALQAQEFGRKLLGKTVRLADDQFVAADLQSAPDYYLVHYSASW